MNDDALGRRLAETAPTGSFDMSVVRDAIAGRAAKEGLLDVAYGTYDSPLGPLTVFVTPRGLARLSYPDEPVEAQVDEMAAAVSPRVMAAPERTDEVRRELDAYFAGTRRTFDIPIDWGVLG